MHSEGSLSILVDDNSNYRNNEDWLLRPVVKFIAEKRMMVNLELVYSEKEVKLSLIRYHVWEV